MIAAGFYSYENLDTGKWQGLLRSTGSELEVVSDGRWKPAAERTLRSVVFPGADAPDRIPRELAKRLAARYGVELEAA